MTALVKRQRCVRQSDEHEHQRRLGDHVRESAADPVDADEPRVERQQAPERADHDRRAEQGRQRGGDRLHRLRPHDADPELQRQQGIEARERRRRSVAAGHHAQRVQLLLEDVADLVGADVQLELGSGPPRDLLQRLPRYRVRGDDEEQARDLNDLPVGSSHVIGRLPERRPLDRSEQLGAGKQTQRVG